MIILTHAPIIITQDKNWSFERLAKEGDIILLPDDAILVVDKEDREVIRFYNQPILIKKP